MELVKKYQVDVTAIALHPSGIFAAVGFNDQMRLMQILLDDLKVYNKSKELANRILQNYPLFLLAHENVQFSQM